MKKRIVILLVALMFALNGYSTSALIVEKGEIEAVKEQDQSTDVITKEKEESPTMAMEEALPSLVFREIPLSESVVVLQVYEYVDWTTSGTLLSDNFQALLSKSVEFDLESYDRIYFEEISFGGDRLASFAFNPSNDYWQKMVFDAAAKEVDASEYSAYEVADYDSFARRPDAHESKLVQITGKILQTMEEDGLTTYRVAQNSNYDHVWLVGKFSSTGEERILEDDIVTFYGSFLGLHTYTTVMGAGVTVPMILATHYELN